MTCGKGDKENGFGHGGNLVDLCARAGTDPERIIDFSANINPLGPPEYLRKVISRSVESLVHYPDPHCRELMLSLTASLGLEEQQLFLANGSTEIIYALPRALACQRAIIPTPSYLDYERAAHLVSLESVQMPLSESDGFRIDFGKLAQLVKPDDLVYLGRPNNPTGVSFDASKMLDVVAQHPEVYFAIDESFFEFIDGASSLISSDMAPNLMVFRSLTKFYAIPGLRLGFGAASPSLAKKIKHHLLPWTVNSLAQAVGTAVLLDNEYAELSRSYVKKRRRGLQDELSRISALHVFPGEANYLLIKLEKTGMTAQFLAERLLNLPEPIAIRTCANFVGLDDRFFRVAVRTNEDNKKLCAALGKKLEPSGRRVIKCRRKTPALMLQGTSSNAGKSVLTAALGRIFLQDGYRVAPFKAQNMSLNSYVTRNGGEMGRAQVVQAQACRLDPEVRMNPVLIKPSSDVGSQVIVNGRPVGNMSVSEYIRFKPEARQSALAAYDSLAAENDIMVLEGAGSPAEVNLKEHDIVNMTMSQHAQSPVLLIGDIDRGGVFASFVGTMEVMSEWERALVAGFIVNRFRGQAALLDDAFRYVEEFTGKGVFGTVPYIHNHGLPEEDSVSFKGGLYEKSRPEGESVGIGVIDLPHISNFTDVEPFLIEPDVHLHIIRSTKDLDKIEPDLAALILPGSKNVMNDLTFLRRSGLVDKICKLADNASMDIIGICGGFQMLGKDIGDPFHLESDGGRIESLGILDMTTTLAEEKTLARQTGLHLPSMQKVQGYEIHHGQTTASHEKILRMDDGSEGGAALADGHVWGSYLHGIFDADDFRRWFIDRLRSSRNMKPLGKVVAPYDLEPAFNKIADIVRESLDINRIYRLLGLK
jgi:cobyric acid synthase CobQ/L-threonine-O-3-phosphate decarboxylase